LPGTKSLPYKAQQDAFVTKLNREGTAVVYTAYLGGSGFDSAQAIGVDAVGNAYVVGSTSSNDFPKTAGAFGGTLEAFVTKFTPGCLAVAERMRQKGWRSEQMAASILPGAPVRAICPQRAFKPHAPAQWFIKPPMVASTGLHQIGD